MQAGRREGSTVDSGQGTRGRAHREHVVHVRDAGGVEAQRLVERRRKLPIVERGAYGAGRGCGPADGGDGVQRAGEGSTADWGRTGVERTWNMACMLVTPEVSQLEMSALNLYAFCRVKSRACDARGKVIF